MQWKYFQLHYIEAIARPQHGSEVTTVCGKRLTFPGPKEDGAVLKESCDTCVFGSVTDEDDPARMSFCEVLEDTGRRS